MYPQVSKDPRGGHNRLHINHGFFRTWSYRMAYILGLIYADGAIEDVQKSSRTCYIQITSKDFEFLNKIKSTLNSSHKITTRPSSFARHSDSKLYKSKVRFNLRIGSKFMFNDLLKLGLTPRKSLTILFPKILKEYLPYFIRGYFDGDGCLYLRERKYPRVIFTSGSTDFLQGLASSLSDVLSVKSYSIFIQHKERKNPCYQLYYSNTDSRIILEFIYRNLSQSPYLERKFKIYQNYLKAFSVAG